MRLVAVRRRREAAGSRVAVGGMVADDGAVVVEEARRLDEVFVLERSAQGGGESDLSCLVKQEILYSVLRW